MSCGIASNHPGAPRHPSLSKEGKFHDSNRMAIVAGVDGWRPRADVHESSAVSHNAPSSSPIS